MPQFNSEQYSWSSVTVQIGSDIIVECQGISYKTNQEKGFVYGKGNNPLSIQRGNKSNEGSVKVLQNTLERLIQKAPNKDLNDYRGLTCSISYEAEDGRTVVDNILGMEFTDVEKAIEQGKTFMEVDLPFIFLQMKYDV
ncbi:hypothetical protein ACAW74_25710 [Fibrella sp. WM1]|uniref:hypothetical protein n=1 Tax=Fibrella musci TaxID=3242485 RepID=UPI003520E745